MHNTKKIVIATIVAGTVAAYRYCENAYLAELRQDFPTLTRKQFYKAWGNAVATSAEQNNGVGDVTLDKMHTIWIRELYKVTNQ